MIIIKKNFKPLVKVITLELNIYALKQAIEEYIMENSLQGHIRGQIQRYLPLSGQVKEHHQDLISYLNSYEDIKNTFKLMSGYFLDANIEHCWAQSDNIIIDIAIQQFKNYPLIAESNIKNAFDFSYLICDDPYELVHQAYLPAYD